MYGTRTSAWEILSVSISTSAESMWLAARRHKITEVSIISPPKPNRGNPSGWRYFFFSFLNLYIEILIYGINCLKLASTAAATFSGCLTPQQGLRHGILVLRNAQAQLPPPLWPATSPPRYEGPTPKNSF